MESELYHERNKRQSREERWDYALSTLLSFGLLCPNHHTISFEAPRLMEIGTYDLLTSPILHSR